jgi:polysaccharide biosynthesis/export protein
LLDETGPGRLPAIRPKEERSLLLARNTMKWKHATVLFAMAAILLVGSGCRWLHPHEVGRYQARPLLRPILSNLNIAEDESADIFGEATEVQPEDLEIIRRDYRLRPNDLISIEVSDLVGLGVNTVVTKRISETGRVSLPLLPEPLNAAGLTEAELEQRIVRTYRDLQLIQDAQVTATVIEPRGRTFSITGAVAAPGQYAILNADFRVLDALVLARDITAPVGVDNIYIIRQLSDQFELIPQPEPAAPMDEDDDLLAPRGRVSPVDRAGGRAGMVHRLQVQPVEPADEPVVVQPAEPGEPLDPADPAPVMDEPEQPFEFNDIAPEAQIRVIRIPLRELRAGDLRYNIIIRPRDMIVVPQPEVGFFYVAGHVLRPGVYNLTGQRITLKQAVMSAAMFDPLAIPKRTDLIRRVGPEREVIVQVDLARLFAGADPDIFLKPHDQILVGTDWYAPFLAAARGAFRMTYGFGFLYDRNFAVDRDRQRFF